MAAMVDSEVLATEMRMVKLFVNDGSSEAFVIEIPLCYLLNEAMAKRVPEDHEGFYFFNPSLTREIMYKMMDYLRYFNQHPMDMNKDFEKPLRATLDVYLAKKPQFAFYQQFVDEIWQNEISKDDRMIRHIMELINYMDPLLIQDSVSEGALERSHLFTLMQLCCMKYASEIKSKSRDEVRKMFIPTAVPSTPSAGAGGTD
jgi:hypothetical protein